jgi:hypothetical protein
MNSNISGGIFMKLAKSLGLVFSLLSLLFFSACGGSGGGSDSGGTGTLSVSLTDAAGSYKAVYITIEGLEVHTGGNDNDDNNWMEISMDKDTINLCELTNGVFEELGSVRLPEGDYNQLRLHLSDTEEDNELNILSELHPSANYAISEDNSVHELKIPSGFQSGVKLVKGFSINENSTTEIILDFDASKSVVEAGNSGKWILKPTIKVGELKEYSIINGRVTNNPDDVGIAGAYVSAQIFDSSAQDDKDKVVIQAGTITDDGGYYSIFVKPGTYNLVAYIDGKEFEFVKVETIAGETLENTDITDFQLVDASAMRTINGEVSINGADDEQYATISYRQDADCLECAADEKVEIKSLNVSNGAEYETELPIIDGDTSYQRVASTFNYETKTRTLNLIAGDTIPDDITF